MTEAEQVACDALRAAGLDELADNLEWALEAVRLRVVVTEMLECNVEGYCAACGVHAESESHRMSCRLLPLFATKKGWAAEELERAHGEALRQSRLRAAPQRVEAVFGVDATSYAVWRGDGRPIPQTPAGRIAVSDFVKNGAVIGFRPSDFLGVAPTDKADD